MIKKFTIPKRTSFRTRLFIVMIGMLVIAGLMILGTTTIQYESQRENYHLGRLTRKEIQIIRHIDYLAEKKKQGLFSYEEEIAKYFHNEISKLPRVKVYGKENIKSPMISFTVDGSHPHDIATIVDKEGVAIRAGQHCTQPLLDFFNLSSTARASIGMYTNKNDIDIFIKALNKAISFFD